LKPLPRGSLGSQQQVPWQPDSCSPNIVVCIDFEIGIPGPEIARRVAALLSLPFIDREIVSLAARKLNLPEPCVAALEGEPDHPIRRWILAAAEADATIGLAGPTSAKTDRLLQPRRPVMKAIREAIKEVAHTPGVIAGHESGYELEQRPDAVRVLLRADPTHRVRLLAEKSDPGEGIGLRRLKELDRAKRAYVKQMHGRPWPEPTRYELALDVGTLSIDSAAEAVVGFVRTARDHQ
jgi:hypothetical protein